VDGVTALGVAPGASLVGKHRGGHAPAHVALLRQITLAPLAARAGLVPKAQGRALRLPLTEEVIAGAWSSTNGPQEHASGGMVVGNRGARARVVMAIHADVERASLVPG
jgi:hypothetical protein